MVYAVCHEFGLEFDAPVQLYVSDFFARQFPQEQQYFSTIITESVNNNRDASLTRMRREMLSRPLEAAVFIGGMEGIFEEYDLFREMHGVEASVIALGAPGGAAGQLADKLGADDRDRIDFARLFHQRLGISVDEERDFVGRKRQGPDLQSE
jgi:hypothetical protein